MNDAFFNEVLADSELVHIEASDTDNLKNDASPSPPNTEQGNVLDLRTYKWEHIYPSFKPSCYLLSDPGIASCVYFSPWALRPRVIEKYQQKIHFRKVAQGF